MDSMTCTSDTAKGMILLSEQGHELNRDEIIKLLSLSDPADIDVFFQAADRVRKKYGFTAIQTGRTFWLKDV